jgi:hypothetical protein
MTLPEFLTQRSDELSTDFAKLSNTEKKDLMTRHLQSKAERDDAPKRLTNIAITRAVNSKLKTIINMVLYYFGHLLLFVKISIVQ